MEAPLKVGVLNDMSDGPPGPGDVERWLRLCVDDLAAAGRLDREVEFVHAWGLGLPGGTAAAVERAYADLAQQDVLLIVGPAIGDNALVATPLAERHRTPTLNWAGAERARGDYMFHLQVGSHEDESIVLARYLAALGLKRVGVACDRSPIGRKHLQFLQSEAEILGLRIVAISGLAPLAEEATAEVDELLDARPDAILYLGLGLAAPAVARALTARGWHGPRAMNTAGLRGYWADFAQVIDGWAYVDMHSDGNRTLAALRERLGVSPAAALAAAKGYDLGRLVAEGLARAPERTRDGVREGLEQVKWLAAAEGHEGTLLGFGVHDRGALHGRYLVMRQWRDGMSVEL
ncbi:ABC transporter substrate-binding protein [Phenylobacterium sp. LjRoot225]|uniref:ABC transporter substrate-binding protein n=1 Tax=Phenylobacterium sp. LjRoot225 TaxID=3342285 RepID=UPI003ECD8174